MSFSTTTTGGDANYTYDWSFGDGQTSTDATPKHTYLNSGAYTVDLTVTDGAGAQFSDSKSISVVLPINGGFIVAADGLKVTFTNATSGGTDLFTYSWNFGDGSSSTATSPNHTYAQSGSYTVVMVATDSNGNRATISQFVTVSVPIIPPVTPPTTPAVAESGGSGGGSLGWLSMFLLAGIGIHRRR